MQTVLHLIRLEKGDSRSVALLDEISCIRDREYAMAMFICYGPYSGQGKMKRCSGSVHNRPPLVCRYYNLKIESSADLK